MKRILVTGGSGFIGRNVAEGLRERYEVSAPPRRELDLTDTEAVERFLRSGSFDVVIHGAVRPGHRNAEDPSNQLYSNLRMYANLTRKRDLFGKLIFLGSGAEYGVSADLRKVPEESFGTFVPSDEHGLSKYMISRDVASRPGDVDLRLFGVFGKHEDYAIRFISNAICKSLFGLPITLRQNRRFDYLYIDDLVPILEHFIEENVRCSAYNATPDCSTELLDLAEMVRDISGNSHPVAVAMVGMGNEYSGDNARLKTEVSGLRLTPVREAISRLHDWYAANRNLIDREKLLVDR